MRASLYIACGLVGGVAGGLLVNAVSDDTPQRAAPRFDDTALRMEIDQLREEVRRTRQRREQASDVDATPDTAGESREKDAPGTEPPASGQGEAEPEGEAPLTVQQVVADLLGKPFGSDESNRLFAWLTRNKEKIGDVIKKLQSEIEADPSNAELHVALATAWVAELTNNTNAGPQRGIVWGQAVESYNAAIKINPEHWQARFGKAFGTSMAPEFLGMRPEAIRQFEELKSLQERQAPATSHVQTYFRLGTLYKDAGNTKKAQEIWEEGLKLFPDSEVLQGTLDASTKK